MNIYALILATLLNPIVPTAREGVVPIGHCRTCLGTGICPNCLGTRRDPRDSTGRCIWGAMWLPRDIPTWLCVCRDCASTWKG